ncbi:hypothetical protein [Actinoalloteichus hymeniacidonis]|uniref:hypothetical protein n=1 Tax=Actinoalloteichus hymeniacidonis TaxID=340345 RepID=UPI0008533193|nr:hypothetical protein [Actinoalloteichus hymeniacidonis]MBB5907353.1 hypothetical protein [Actinoalloteichus hymeniacidonis]
MATLVLTVIGLLLGPVGSAVADPAPSRTDTARTAVSDGDRPTTNAEEISPLDCPSIPPNHDPDVIATVYRVGLSMSVSDKVMLAGFEAGWVESHMNNLPCGDRDSLGVFQQRPSQGWGTPEQVMDVSYASRSFFSEAKLLEPRYPNLSAGLLADRVQRSCCPWRYDEAEGRARAMIDEARRAVGPGIPPVQDLRDFTTSGSSVATATALDGRIEVFSSDASGTTHRWQTAPADGRPGGGNWSEWTATGGPANAEIALSRTPDGRIEQFALTADALWHRFQTSLEGAWSDWTQFGPGGVDVATAVSRDGRLEIFVVHDIGIRHRWQTSPADGRPGGGGWSEWVETGGPGGSELVVDVAPDGRLEQLAVTEAATWHRFQTTIDGAWSSWGEFGPGGTDVTTVAAFDGRLEIFVAYDIGIRHRWQTSPADGRPGGGGWSEWVETGGPGAARLTMALAPGGRLEQFATTAAGVRHRYQTDLHGNWSAWSDFGPGGTDLAATRNPDGRIEVFLAVGDGTSEMQTRWHTRPADGTPGGGTWSDWGVFRAQTV